MKKAEEKKAEEKKAEEKIAEEKIAEEKKAEEKKAEEKKAEEKKAEEKMVCSWVFVFVGVERERRTPHLEIAYPSRPHLGRSQRSTLPECNGRASLWENVLDDQRWSPVPGKYVLVQGSRVRARDRSDQAAGSDCREGAGPAPRRSAHRVTPSTTDCLPDLAATANLIQRVTGHYAGDKGPLLRG